MWHISSFMLQFYLSKNKYVTCAFTQKVVILTADQRYIHRVLQTIQMKLILLWVWAEPAVLGRAKTALKFKYEI